VREEGEEERVRWGGGKWGRGGGEEEGGERRKTGVVPAAKYKAKNVTTRGLNRFGAVTAA